MTYVWCANIYSITDLSSVKSSFSYCSLCSSRLYSIFIDNDKNDWRCFRLLFCGDKLSSSRPTSASPPSTPTDAPLLKTGQQNHSITHRGAVEIWADQYETKFTIIYTERCFCGLLGLVFGDGADINIFLFEVLLKGLMLVLVLMSVCMSLEVDYFRWCKEALNLLLSMMSFLRTNPISSAIWVHNLLFVLWDLLFIIEINELYY